MRRSYGSLSSLMAPPLFHYNSSIRGCASKGGASLAKIIAIIFTVPPSPDHLQPNTSSRPEVKQALGVDLNLRLGPPQEIPGTTAVEEKGVAVPSLAELGNISVGDKGSEMVAAVVEFLISPAESAAQDVSAAGKSSEGECDPEEIPAESQKEVSEITDAPFKAQEEKEEEEVVKEGQDEARGGEREGRGDKGEGYLDLLLEAVRQVSGGLFDEHKPGEEEEEKEAARASSAVTGEKKREGTARPRRRRTWWEASAWGLYEEAVGESAPLVRSKRGRSQALPSRYRDSVLEPWAKLPSSGLGARWPRHRTSR